MLLAVRCSMLFLLLPFLIAAQPEKCYSTLKSAGVTDSFGANVGHAIHSMTVRFLKRFEPTVTEKNRVPTINLDNDSDEAIIPYAPDRQGPSAGMFHSEGMKTLDEVLSHMDDKKYDINFFTPLEKVVHAFHMEEAWAMTHHQYESLKANPPSSDVCKCAMDVENNGVLKMLRFAALSIREPMLVYGDKMTYYKMDPKKRGYYVQGGYTYHFLSPKAWAQSQLSPEQILMKEDQSMPRLNSAAAWEKWKSIGKMDMAEHLDTALFLYCALNTNL